jgi:glycosyltransferase involved in cell wall biosynthesis
MNELIVHQKTGFLVENVTQAIQAVKQLDKINRKDCRQWAATHFSQETMVENYLILYKKILSC